ncbi:hypothetical protein [Emticicia sp. SJ17W-69]|uniref:hypothetical protein n=1 Tax=Emticicia sp. SJ17W-69 TaxID=3421657 RepID=UPI003EBA8E2B
MKKLLFTFVFLFLQVSNIVAQNIITKDSLEKSEFSIEKSPQVKFDNQRKIEKFEISNEFKNVLFRRKMRAKRKYKSNLLPLNCAENSLRNVTC